ncbi:MAG: UDP-N-acetylmuramate--L-alanine ligase [Paramuribaculum sp.]|nr:UDP-N-acetylmuramate--L-alanine ligase [Paramuribaculum sp.]
MEEKKNIYFIGAGGIGMAALERYFLSKGKNIAGYDRTPTALTTDLAEEGVNITFGGEVSEIPAEMRDPSTTVVVYTPAVPSDLPIFKWFKENGFTPLKRAAVLGEITRSSKGICVAGTHGKTTTSSMIAHILHSSSTGCNAFLGGVLRNYGTNFLLNPKSEYSVIEADEYDRSFHHLTPHIAVITSAEPDHLDIYGTEEAYMESFSRFTELIAPGGRLLMHTGVKVMPRTAEGVTIHSYGRDNGDYHAENIHISDGSITYDFVGPDIRIDGIELGVPVEINIDNSIAALAAIHLAGVLEPAKAREASASFMGPKRRFEFHLKEEGEKGHVIIDDYAHHPAELRASIESVRKLYPGRHLTVAFQPHLYSRTRDFADDFAAALSLPDSTFLLDIYPAREEPIPGVNSNMLLDRIDSSDKHLISKEILAETLKKRNFEVLLTVGAGDIYETIPDIISAIQND